MVSTLDHEMSTSARAIRASFWTFPLFLNRKTGNPVRRLRSELYLFLRFPRKWPTRAPSHKSVKLGSFAVPQKKAWRPVARRWPASGCSFAKNTDSLCPRAKASLAAQPKSPRRSRRSCASCSKSFPSPALAQPTQGRSRLLAGLSSLKSRACVT